MNHPTFSSETIQAICEALQRAGVEFAFGIRDYGIVWLEPAHIPALLHDREAFEASCVGVSLRDYRRWQESGGEVYCAALTRRGRRCKNLLARSLPPQGLSRVRTAQRLLRDSQRRPAVTPADEAHFIAL